MIWVFDDRRWSEHRQERYSQIREFVGPESGAAFKAEMNENLIYFFADLTAPEEKVEESCAHEWNEILKCGQDSWFIESALILCESCSELRIVKTYDYDDVRVSWAGKKV